MHGYSTNILNMILCTNNTNNMDIQLKFNALYIE